jgi:N-acetylmuramoyl-L-alanine amidase
MIYVTAGHSNQDPGASGNGYTEAALAKEFRDLVLRQLSNMNIKAWFDNDNDTLNSVLQKMNPNESDVCLDIHFNAGPPTATGVEVITADRFTREELGAATRMSVNCSKILGIRNRGVKTEKDTARKMIGILRNEKGINLLLEICFISNANDMKAYQSKKRELAVEVALHVAELDNVFA